VAGTAVAQQGAGSTGEDRSHPPAAYGQPGVPDCIDPGIERVQPALRDAMLDCAPAEAHRQQLPAGDDSVLSLGELADPRVHWSTFTTYFMADVDHLAHRPDHRTETRT
jgi:hypothetical protein